MVFRQPAPSRLLVGVNRDVIERPIAVNESFAGPDGQSLTASAHRDNHTEPR